MKSANFMRNLFKLSAFLQNNYFFIFPIHVQLGSYFNIRQYIFYLHSHESLKCSFFISLPIVQLSSSYQGSEIIIRYCMHGKQVKDTYGITFRVLHNSEIFTSAITLILLLCCCAAKAKCNSTQNMCTQFLCSAVHYLDNISTPKYKHNFGEKFVAESKT